MSKETGGPAFPTKSYDLERENTVREEGMTLRDYFAAKAMQGLTMRQDGAGFDFARAPNDVMRVAMWAYDVADAMMEARK